MRILVTGGAGFIGSHIVDKYINLGHKVVVIDDLSSGSQQNLNPQAKFYKTDITDSEKLEGIFKKEKPDIVNHHAAISSIAKSQKNPKRTYEVNVLGTVNLIELAKKYKVEKFIFISTGGAMYGNVPQEKLPAKETDSVSPVSIYAFTKLLGEQVVKFYAGQHNFKYLILRYANVYGPRQNPNGEAGVVAIFTGLMKQGKQPTIFGDGSKTRDYIYVDDIVEANVQSLTKGENEILNLGWGVQVNDQEIFKVIAENLNYKNKPKFAPFRTEELMYSSLNSKKTQKILSWKPKIKLKQGIQLTTPTI